MQIGLYCVFDTVAELFGPVFEARNDGVALRNCEKLFQQENVREDDFVLYQIGLQDKETGKIEEGYGGPRQIRKNLSIEMEAQ